MDAGPPRRSGAEVDPLHPHHLLIHHGYTYLQSRMDGQIGEEAQEGLFDFDTRILSWYRLTIDGAKEPIGVAAPSLTSDRWQAMLSTTFGDGSPEGPRLPQDALEVRVERRVGLGLAERLIFTNHSMVDRSVEVAVELGSDFRDVGEVEGSRRQSGEIDHRWDGGNCSLTMLYTAEHGGRRLERGLRVRLAGIAGISSVARLTDGVPSDEVRYRLAFRLELKPKGCRSVRLDMDSLVDGAWRTPTDRATGEPVTELAARDRRRDHVRIERPEVEGVDSLVPAMIEQAADDLLALRNWDLERAGEGWIVNAGVPEFTGFFGRDMIATGVQSAMLGPGPLRGALARAAETQGSRRDGAREEEPGRIVHEMRRGPLADLAIRPHGRFYGSHTGPAAFVHALSELWHWTGDEAVLRRFAPHAERAMSWAAHFGDLDGDGILEYVQRSEEGLKNQGWKDSNEAIRYPDGRIVENPVAPVEEQALHFLALQRLAEIQVALGHDDAADGNLRGAATVRRLVEERYWLEDEGYYALALDSHGEPVRTIASNPLHLLSAGLTTPERARRVADRLLAPDLFSGWGIRTLSSDHPSYNPFSYHLGSVWPVEMAIFANGCKRYGFDDAVERIVSAAFGAAGHCHMLRLPEVLGGHDRAVTKIPTTYPGAKSPQAWSASSTIFMLQSLLGIMPFAPSGSLGLIRPTLPPWLPTITIRRLRVGEGMVDLRFERTPDGATAHEVLGTSGGVRVARVPPPNAEPVGVREHAARAVAAAMPGRLGRAGRIAMGLEDG